MNDLDGFALLAARARREGAPRQDVSARVLARLRRGDRRPLPGWSLAIFSGLSAAAASTVLLIALRSWLALSDPLAALFGPLTMVML